MPQRAAGPARQGPQWPRGAPGGQRRLRARQVLSRRGARALPGSRGRTGYCRGAGKPGHHRLPARAIWTGPRRFARKCSHCDAPVETSVASPWRSSISGNVAFIRREFDRAIELYDEARVLSLETDDQWILATSLGNIGGALIRKARTGSPGGVRGSGITWPKWSLAQHRSFEKALIISRDLGDRERILDGLLTLADAAAPTNPEHAALLLGAADALAAATGYQLAPSRSGAPQECGGNGPRELWAKPRSTSAWRAGEHLSLEETIAAALESGVDPARRGESHGEQARHIRRGRSRSTCPGRSCLPASDQPRIRDLLADGRRCCPGEDTCIPCIPSRWPRSPCPSMCRNGQLLFWIITSQPSSGSSLQSRKLRPQRKTQP